MRVATYNIWNHKSAFEARLHALCDELSKLNADVIALREVPWKFGEQADASFLEVVARTTGYEYYLFKPYPGDDEGLVFFKPVAT